MRFTVNHNSSYLNERKYIYDVIFRDLLGFEYTANIEPRSDVKITVDSVPDKQLIIADTLFQTPQTDWLTAKSLPKQPLEYCDLADLPTGSIYTAQKMPVIYGQKPAEQTYFVFAADKINLGVDIFGSAFFMLTRLEEFVKSERDAYQRFPTRYSLAYQENFLRRPIVNEYIELLKSCLSFLWPGLRYPERTFRVSLSHDVDIPFDILWRPAGKILKSIAAELVKRGNPEVAFRRLKNLVCGGPDTFDTFDYIMSLSEEHGFRSAFNFKTASTHAEYDSYYPIGHPRLRTLIKTMLSRGHEIGFHPSYESFRSPQQISEEFQALLAVAREEEVVQEQWGGRHHYLRWETPATWQSWEDAGLNYDASVGCHDEVGFRSGICYEYRVFNLKTRQPLKLIEKPLIVMDGALFEVMNLSRDQAEQVTLELAAACKTFAGCFTLLWHNNNLAPAEKHALYSTIVQKLSAM